MKWFLFFLALAATLIIASHAKAAPASPTIYVVNESAVITAADLEDALPVFQAAVDEDFAPYWHADAQLVVGTPPVGGWAITLSDDASFWAEGWHDVNKQGAPYARVLTSSPDDWHIIFTHELFELLADPWTTRSVLVGKRFYIVETADPVEQQSYTRTAPSGATIPVSDFVTPNWFRRGSAGPYDFMGAVKRPLQVLEGGYQLVWKNGVWVSL